MKKNKLIIISLIFMLFINLNNIKANTFDNEFQYTNDLTTHTIENNFLPNTLDNGRVWVDKSVNKSITFGYTKDNLSRKKTINADTDTFLVTLSSLAQSYTVSKVKTPIDAVFTIDLSASMSAYGMNGNYVNGNEKTRDYILVNSLNKAMSEFLNDNEYNRVAVVGFSGQQTITLLELNHYSSSSETYFKIENIGNAHTISVNNDVKASDNSIVDYSSYNVLGGTNTQMGLKATSELFLNADTNFEYYDENSKQTYNIKRKPIIILMSDGDPTYGWLDYTMNSATAQNYDAGNGVPRQGDIGTDLLTILTASYIKEEVSQHYYPNGSDKAIFYTLGVGDNSDDAAAVLNPKDSAVLINHNLNGVDYNLKNLLDDYTNNLDISFPLNVLNSNNRWYLANLVNNNDISDYRYNDQYYPATDEKALEDALDSISHNIISEGGYVTISTNNPNNSGFVIISDVIGKYMEYKNDKGIFYNGELWFGRNFARVVGSGPDNNDAWDKYIGVLEEALTINENKASNLLISNYQAHNIYYNSDDDFKNVIKYYIDENMNVIQSYYDNNGNVLAQPSNAKGVAELHAYFLGTYNNVTGNETNLSFTLVSITTALEDTTFNLKFTGGSTVELIKNQQFVRMRIPASLLPLRSVKPTCDDPDVVDLKECKQEQLHIDVNESVFPVRYNYTVGFQKDFDLSKVSDEYLKNNKSNDGYYFYEADYDVVDKDNNNALAVFQPALDNPYYYYTIESSLYEFDGNDYVLAQDFDASKQYYTKEEYFDANVNGYLNTTYLAVNTNYTKISIKDNGIPYIKQGEYKTRASSTMLKSNNLTETNNYVKATVFTEDQNNETYVKGYLGNNGRLLIQPTSLTIKKKWQGKELNEIYFQIYKNNIPYLNPIKLDINNNWEINIDNLLIFDPVSNSNNTLDENVYTVKEGKLIDNKFVAYDDTTDENYNIEIIQPQLNNRLLSNATITNTEPNFNSNDDKQDTCEDQASCNKEDDSMTNIPDNEDNIDNKEENKDSNNKVNNNKDNQQLSNAGYDISEISYLLLILIIIPSYYIIKLKYQDN